MKYLPSQHRRKNHPDESFVVSWLEAIFFIIALWGTATWAAGQPPRQGDPLPEIRLTAPDQLPQRAYLGVDRAGDFAISQIRAEVLIIEIFSMYCPYCQREAPRVNRLFETIHQDPDLAKRLKLSDFWPHGAVAARYGILRSDGTAERALFFIDKNGIIRHIQISDINVRPKLEMVLEGLEKADEH